MIDKNIIEKGGGHNMAAGFTMKKDNLKILDNFIQKDYLKKKKFLSKIIQINTTQRYQVRSLIINLYKKLIRLDPMEVVIFCQFF